MSIETLQGVMNDEIYLLLFKYSESVRLHVLIYAFSTRNLAQDVKKKKAEPKLSDVHSAMKNERSCSCGGVALAKPYARWSRHLVSPKSSTWAEVTP